MIGFYNYTVILTYVGLLFTVFGMTQVFSGNYPIALLCLIVSGICDMFDGMIARTKKDRTKQEKMFGIQIDSLCDVVCFGVYPAVIGYSIVMRENGSQVLGTIACMMFILAAVIRLGYFNVMEMERQEQTTEKRKYYQGLPVTSVDLIMPLIYAICQYGKLLPLAPTYCITLIVISILFVLNIKIPKPGLGIVIFTLVGFVIFVGVFLFFK